MTELSLPSTPPPAQLSMPPAPAVEVEVLSPSTSQPTDVAPAAPAIESPTERALLDRLARMEAMMGTLSERHLENERNSVATQERQRLEGALGAATRGVKSAEQALTQALETSESTQDLAKAQTGYMRALQDEASAKGALEAFNAQVEAAKQRASAPQQAPAKDRTNLDRFTAAWGAVLDQPEVKHTALAFDAAVKAEGRFPVGSESYFNEITNRLNTWGAQRYGAGWQPRGVGVFAPAPPPAQQPPPAGPLPVGPPLASGRFGGQQPPSAGERRTLRVTQEQYDLMNRWGVTPDKWMAARDRAVAKGHMPAEPHLGPIVERR